MPSLMMLIGLRRSIGLGRSKARAEPLCIIEERLIVSHRSVHRFRDSDLPIQLWKKAHPSIQQQSSRVCVSETARASDSIARRSRRALLFHFNQTKLPGDRPRPKIDPPRTISGLFLQLFIHPQAPPGVETPKARPAAF
jgi:hypothetical protein